MSKLLSRFSKNFKKSYFRLSHQFICKRGQLGLIMLRFIWFGLLGLFKDCFELGLSSNKGPFFPIDHPLFYLRNANPHIFSFLLSSQLWLGSHFRSHCMMNLKQKCMFTVHCLAFKSLSNFSLYYFQYFFLFFSAIQEVNY